MRQRIVRVFVVFVVGVVSACSTTPDPAQELERRILAPCCWRQTLEDHDSPMATALRAEIATRLAGGASVAVIEADLVRRYGDRVRALPEGNDPRWVIGAVVGIALLVGIGLLAVAARRRRRRPAPIAAPSTRDVGPYADRLDDELLAID